MGSSFDLLGAPHVAIVAAIPALAALLAWWARRSPGVARPLRFALGSVLALNDLAWYSYELAHGWMRFPQTLPLQLSDLTNWVTILAAFTLKPWSFELCYYWGLVGATMAVLTPDLWEPFPSYPTVQFFISHGFVVITALYLVWAKQARPRAGSVWRAFAALNAYALAIGVFNGVFGANYMFINAKPARFSLLSWLGPWPVYVLSADLLAWIGFRLLWLPFRKSGR